MTPLAVLASHIRTGAVLGASLSLLACCSATASAQPAVDSFQDLQNRLRIGDIIYVTNESGLETKGRVEVVSDASVRLKVEGVRRDFLEPAIARVERRRHDSVRNGLLIGLGSGAALGFLAGKAADSPTCLRSGTECGQGALIGTVGGAIWGGVGGWIVDALTRPREIVYRAAARP